MKHDREDNVIGDKTWYPVDNVANIFLASCNYRNTRTMRISCTLKEMVDPVTLQQALDDTIKVRKQFQVHVKRGLFWHYLEESDVRPIVTEEDGTVCPLLFHPNRPDELHYNLKYYKKRISLEIFHALTDGTGAMEFLNNIVLTYLKIKHPGLENTSGFGSTSKEALFEDAYKKYADSKVAASKSSTDAFHNPGRKLPFDQLRFFDIDLPLKDVLAKAKKADLSLTSYLAAKFVLAFATEMSANSSKKNINLSLPVNLRNFFPSETARNFFNNITLSHTYTGREKIESVGREMREQMEEQLEKEVLKSHMSYYVGVQQNKAVRPVPLFLKQNGLKFLSNLDGAKVSAVLSNMGKVKIPEEMRSYIEYYCCYCSSENIFVVVSSFNDHLLLNVSSPYVDNSVLRNLVRDFAKDGIKVKVNATEVVN